MLAIVKKELKSYFVSMTGYIFLGLLLLLVGLYFYAFNIYYGSVHFSSTLSSCSMFLLIFVPTLTMRLFAEESRQKTDQLLYTSPLTVNQIVVGKFLAAFLLFLLGMALTMIFPLILTRFGTIPFAETAGSYVGYILMGACFIGIGLFISSLTDNQIIAAVATIAILFVMLSLVDWLAVNFPTDRISAAVFLAVIGGVIAFFIYDGTRNMYAGIIFMVLFLAAEVAMYFLNGAFYDELVSNILFWFSLSKRFQNFSAGLLYLSDVLYYITFTVVFVFLTANTIEKRRWR